MSEELLFLNRAQRQLERQAHKRYLGVHWHKASQKWFAKIGSKVFGYRADREEALKLRLLHEKDTYGILPEREWLFREVLPHHLTTPISTDS